MKNTKKTLLLSIITAGITLVMPAVLLYADLQESDPRGDNGEEKTVFELMDEMYFLSYEIEIQKEEIEKEQAVLEIIEHGIEVKAAAEVYSEEDLIFIASQEEMCEMEMFRIDEIQGELNESSCTLQYLSEELENIRNAEECTAAEIITEENKDDENSDKVKDDDNTKEEEGLLWPLPEQYGPWCITSLYGYRTHPITGTADSFHGGIDIAAPKDTPVYACADGVVVLNTYDASAGIWTVIYHGDGVYTEYMHQSYLGIVCEGQPVKRGEIIGYVGTTGSSTGYHLHIGLIYSNNTFENGRRVDPAPYLGVY